MALRESAVLQTVLEGGRKPLRLILVPRRNRLHVAVRSNVTVSLFHVHCTVRSSGAVYLFHVQCTNLFVPCTFHVPRLKSIIVSNDTDDIKQCNLRVLSVRTVTNKSSHRNVYQGDVAGLSFFSNKRRDPSVCDVLSREGCYRTIDALMCSGTYRCFAVIFLSFISRSLF